MGITVLYRNVYSLFCEKKNIYIRLYTAHCYLQNKHVSNKLLALILLIVRYAMKKREYKCAFSTRLSSNP